MIHNETLLYWIAERWRILKAKETGKPPPWSSDPIFQTVYFCNVRREDDKVTRFIRSFYASYYNHPNLIYNYVFSRFVNWPETIQYVGWMDEHKPDHLEAMLEDCRQHHSKVWGGAYVITTHGLPMAKAAYMVDHVLGGLWDGLGRPGISGPHPVLPPTLSGLHSLLMRFEGLGSFLAAQIVADLKNTHGHEMVNAPDWSTFVAHGPGSLRGASWVKFGNKDEVSVGTFPYVFQEIREYVDKWLPKDIPKFCNQDLQNCLCEFDKYMRVSTGTGRSKRNYDGLNSR